MPARASAGPKGERPPRICNVATKCVSREDFLRSFSPFVDDTTLFIPTKLAFEIGQLVRFQVSLADGTVVLAGIGEACELLTGPTGPLGKSGVRFLIKDIDEPSRALREELAARRRKAVAAGVAAPSVEPAEPARLTNTMQGMPPSRPAEAPPPRVAPAPPRAPLIAASPPAAPRSAAPAAPATPALRAQVAPTMMAQPSPPELRPEPRMEMPPEAHPDPSGHRMDTLAQPRIEAPPPEPYAPPQPEPFPQGSLNLPRNEHDPFNEATLSANDPDEQTRQDLKAEALGRLATESDFSSARPPRFAQPAPPAPPPVLGGAFEDDAFALAELRPGRLRRLAPMVLGTVAALLVAFVVWMKVTRPREAPAAAEPLAGEAAPQPAAAAVPAPVPAPAPPAPPRPAAEPLPPPESPPVAREAAPESPPPVREAEPEPPPVAREKAPVSPPPRQKAEVTGPRRCQARIDSRPRGATVTLGKLTLGRTPLSRTAVPCGAVSVTISHARYLPATVALDAAPNAPVSVSARLSRPVAQLQLASSPDGAVFKINGDRVGRGPRNVTVSRFESVKVEARLPGMKPWVRKIYVRDSVTEVVATFNR
jgi:hypothetical protein